MIESGLNLRQGEKPFIAIAAMAENRVIGLRNRIPWRLPEDFRWFKEMTQGQIVVMGRHTFDSIGRPLPDRTTIVLSRSRAQIPGVCVASSLADLDFPNDNRVIFICGGAEVYAQALPLCAELYLTLVKRVVEGDRFFPRFEDEFVPVETVLDLPEFRITHYSRNRQ